MPIFVAKPDVGKTTRITTKTSEIAGKSPEMVML
jgi:hypothetical protein